MNGNTWKLVQTIFVMLLIALLGVFINQSVANSDRVHRIEVEQVELKTRQEATDKNLERIAKDIDEIKGDVKQLLKRGN